MSRYHFDVYGGIRRANFLLKTLDEDSYRPSHGRGEVVDFRYKKPSEYPFGDKNARVLALAVGPHETSGNELLYGINLNKLTREQEETLLQYWGDIAKHRNPRDRYAAIRNHPVISELIPHLTDDYSAVSPNSEIGGAYATWRLDRMKDVDAVTVDCSAYKAPSEVQDMPIPRIDGVPKTDRRAPQPRTTEPTMEPYMPQPLYPTQQVPVEPPALAPVPPPDMPAPPSDMSAIPAGEAVPDVFVPGVNMPPEMQWPKDQKTPAGAAVAPPPPPRRAPQAVQPPHATPATNTPATLPADMDENPDGQMFNDSRDDLMNRLEQRFNET